MAEQSRLYHALLAAHLRQHRQMAFFSGPRQVGKTTTCRGIQADARYLNWDDQDHRRLILQGPGAVAGVLGLDRLRARRPVLVLDEIHKYARWKGFLKGLFDVHGAAMRIVVTGSSRLDVYRRGGDSLMGRYFLYHMHPFSVGELVRPSVPREAIRPPRPLPEREFQALWDHGGYPEPFLKRNPRFSLRWRGLRRQQLVREDLRDLTRVQEIGQMEVFVEILGASSSSPLVYANLAREVNVSVDTVRRWITTLSFLYFGFLVRPWFRNVAKSLRKEPKWYSLDWSGVEDPGARAETFVACQLLKAVQGWQDLGLGTFDLHYLRDKQQREVDFLVVRNRKPWFLVEVKRSETALSPSLGHFQSQTGAGHAFQAVLDLDFEAADCFSRSDPCIVPARTLLSQLL